MVGGVVVEVVGGTVVGAVVDMGSGVVAPEVTFVALDAAVDGGVGVCEVCAAVAVLEHAAPARASTATAAGRLARRITRESLRAEGPGHERSACRRLRTRLSR